jgi:hypothetical protein
MVILTNGLEAALSLGLDKLKINGRNIMVAMACGPEHKEGR